MLRAISSNIFPGVIRIIFHATRSSFLDYIVNEKHWQLSSRRSEVSFHPFCLQLLNFTFASVLCGVRTAKQPVFSPRLRTRARVVKGKVWGEGEATRFERK